MISAMRCAAFIFCCSTTRAHSSVSTVWKNTYLSNNYVSRGEVEEFVPNASSKPVQWRVFEKESNMFLF
uniref:Putative secreted protein n=1 Tax=Anopheles triannulatus TaxID=58253 RepID=A0A2M4B3K7_9DIPT